MLDGLREVREELGLAPDPARLVPLGTRRVGQEIPAGMDREFHEVFLLFESLRPGDVRLQREEVGALLRLRLSDVESLYAGEKIPAGEWTADGKVQEAMVSLGEFVPNEDRYPLAVARAVEKCLVGGEVGENLRGPIAPLAVEVSGFLPQLLLHLPGGEPGPPLGPPQVPLLVVTVKVERSVLQGDGLGRGGG